MGEQGVAIGGANMWALLLDKDPGDSAAAGDLAVDVVDRKLKKAGGTAVVEVPKATPAKRGEMVKKEKRGADGGSKQAPATVDCGQVHKNGSLDSKQAAAAAAATVVDRKLKKAGVTAVVEVAKAMPAKHDNMVKKKKQGAAGCSEQAPATVECGQVQTNGAGCSKQAAASVTVPDDGEKPTSASREEIRRKLAALLGLEEGGEVQMNGAGYGKQAAASATVSDDGEKLTSASREEIRRTLYALLGLEEGEAEEEAKEEEVFDVVAARRGRRRTVAAPTSKPAVAAEGSSTAVTGSNMWALLRDDDPGHGGARPAKRGKKSKTKKKKKNAAGATVDEDGEEEAPAGGLEEETSEEEGEEMAGEAATVGSRCRTVASRVCVCAAVAVGVLGLFCQLVFPVAV